MNIKIIKSLFIGAILGLSVVMASDAQATVYFSKPGFYCNGNQCYAYRHVWRCNHGFCTTQTIYYPHQPAWYRYY